MIGGAILAGIIVVGLIFSSWLLGIYNSIVKQDQNVQTAQASVQVEYQRRFDLVPNLVNATRGYMKQEVKVFDDIAQARTHYAGAAPGSNDQIQATNQYEGALSRLLIVMENYPVLQSVSVVKDLTANLEGTENRIQIARDRFNEQVRVYNMNIVTFPRNVIAGMFGFQAKQYYQSDEGASKAPTVNLDVE